MRKYKQIKKAVPVLKEVRCNKCGKDIALKPHIEHGCMKGCHVEMRHGYGSKHDGDVVRFDLCDECTDEITESFKLKCEVTQEL